MPTKILSDYFWRKEWAYVLKVTFLLIFIILYCLNYFNRHTIVNEHQTVFIIWNRSREIIILLRKALGLSHARVLARSPCEGCLYLSSIILVFFVNIASKLFSVDLKIKQPVFIFSYWGKREQCQCPAAFWKICFSENSF